MFFSRVVEATADPTRFQETLETTRATILPLVRDLPGFAGQYWLGDRETGQVLACTFYDSKDALVASRQQAQQIRDAGIQAGGATIKGVKEYEVIANTGDKVHTSATHARATLSKGDPARAEQAVTVVRDVVIPAARQIPGFDGGVWMLDRETGEGLSLTLYASEAEFRQSGDQAAGVRQQAINQGQLELLSVTEFEIVARTETPVTAGHATG